MNEWPKPISELLEQLQELSRKIEPEITTLGEEPDKTVKKLREELQSRRRRESE